MINQVEWIRDVIYDYICFTKSQDTKYCAEKDIIDSPYFQRLRRILQLQSSWLIFPNAVHSRFLHSLGVMHLAGELAHHLYPFFKQAFPDEDIPEEQNYVVEVFRIAGLLHDIGHGPLGHLIDEVYTYPHYKKTHEDISCKIITEELGDIIKKLNTSPYGSFEQTIDPEQIIKFVKMPQDFKNFSLWEQVFSKIMFGIYNVDTIDFLLRDKYFTGMKEVGDINYHNLFNQSYISERGLTLKKTALSTLRSLLSIRLSLFKNVYFNAKKCIIEKSLGELIPDVFQCLKIDNPYDNLDKYQLLDDFSLMTHLRLWKTEKSGSKKKLAEKWLKIYDTREIKYKKIYEKEQYIYKFISKNNILSDEELESKVKNILGDYSFTIGRDILDVRNKNLFISNINKENFKQQDNLRSIAVFDEDTNKFLENDEQIMEDIPLKYFILRVFADKDTPITSLDKTNLEDAQLELSLGNNHINEQKNRTEITNV